MTVISVKNLSMTYKVPVRTAGLKASIGSLFKRQFREVQAVRGVNFSLERGEVVGFIGPNGAGKTTTLKMLSGILHPSSGEASVLNCIPWIRQNSFLRQIAMIRGSRPIAVPGELTVFDALEFQKKIYEVPEDQFKKNASDLIEMLNIGPLLQRQVRALSLGEKMRSGLAWSLLYRPKVLFLDEPTIGLDVSATNMMRKFIQEYSQNTGATILLTSHYMADLETLCKRVILIDKGELTYDGSLVRLYEKMTPYKLLKLTVNRGKEDSYWESFGDVVLNEGERIVLRLRREDVTLVTTRLLSECLILDLAIEEPPLEDVIDQVYKEGVVV